jgi:hypothetical protein
MRALPVRYEGPALFAENGGPGISLYGIILLPREESAPGPCDKSHGPHGTPKSHILKCLLRRSLHTDSIPAADHPLTGCTDKTSGSELSEASSHSLAAAGVQHGTSAPSVQ